MAACSVSREAAREVSSVCCAASTCVRVRVSVSVRVRVRDRVRVRVRAACAAPLVPV